MGLFQMLKNRKQNIDSNTSGAVKGKETGDTFGKPQTKPKKKNKTSSLRRKVVPYS